MVVCSADWFPPGLVCLGLFLFASVLTASFVYLLVLFSFFLSVCMRVLFFFLFLLCFCLFSGFFVVACLAIVHSLFVSSVVSLF